MWLSIPSTESITRPRLAVVIVSAVAAASVAYYAYQNRTSQPLELPPGGGLHRSNAVRRRRHRRNDDGSSSSSEAPGDENVDIDTVRPLGDAETTVDTGDDWWNEPSSFPNQRAGHNIVNLLFRVSEDNARRNGCVHRGCQCNSCGMVPIRGVRYRCANCADFDLCETCEAQGVHIKTHIFYKIRVPAPPFGPRQMQAVWYTGDPDTCRRNLPRGLILKLSRDTGFERPELEAFWEQWTFMANTEWREDPDELGIAMDRKTFERCLVPTGGSRHAAPNLIHDRMFSFYDSNRDDLIGFTEFLHGLSYRKRKGKLHKVFEGYDIDEDGYVDRRDFLRMFRAYYVLYKQMHKDILDGLEDQLLASTEAQQLINSRQPLSSLFGREGRVPSGDSTLRHQGKIYHHDGRIEITDNHESVVVEDRGDTARREDILTSLFACETDRRSHRRLITRNDTDNNWRTVHRLSGSHTERTYLVTLLDPPSRLDQLPGLFEIEEPLDHAEETEDESEFDDSALYLDTRDYPDTESEQREAYITRVREKAPKTEKRKKEMARKKLHERWRRRQFYLDEEEGGVAPEDWGPDEDILGNFRETGESSRSAAESTFSHASGSSSRVRFAEKSNGKAPEPNGTEPPRDMRPRWGGGWALPNAERDAGKEILYQVTQQAFNELLDTIFKPSEDLAMQAAETKDQREKYKHLLEKIDPKEDKGKEPSASPNAEAASSKVQWAEEKSLEDLLSESGYRVVPHDDEANGTDAETRNGISRDPETLRRLVGEQEPEREELRDLTLPQFRPETSSDFNPSYIWYPITNPASETDSEKKAGKLPAEVESEPSFETLQQWARLNAAEAKAEERGGWGKLNFQEFEVIYKSQEHQGNRLDYLGSWIDFCIP